MTTEQIWAALKEAASVLGTNTGHGHVWGRPDGLMVRCGGPGVCELCTLDAAMFLPNPGTILALEAEHSRLRAENERLRRRARDAEYRALAYQNMLGPKGAEVAARWDAAGVQRIHVDWDEFANTMTGEERAAELLDMEDQIARAALNTDEAHK